MNTTMKTKSLLLTGMLTALLCTAAPAFALGHELPAPPRGPLQGLGQLIRPPQGPRADAHMEQFGGKITAVSSPSFTLELPAIGRQATTTITVMTNASTTYRLASTTASWSDVAVGDFAMVSGPFATSTQTLTANRVQLSITAPNRGQEVRAVVHDAIDQRVNEMLSTTTRPAQLRGFIGNLIQSIFSIFHR